LPQTFKECINCIKGSRRFFSEEHDCNSKEYLFSRPAFKTSVSLAQVAELVDALDSKSSFLGSAGSIPALGTF
jgi:hypothetical protein